MAMQVEDQLELVVVSHFPDPFFNLVNGFVELGIRKVPNPVEVSPCVAGPVIAHLHSLDIHHWDQKHGEKLLNLDAFLIPQF